MNSTTLKISLAGTVFYLSCRRREKFCLGSATDCKLSLDGEGIEPEHCEIERLDSDTFAVRSLDDAPTTVNGVRSPELVVESPFEIRVGEFDISVELVDDKEAEGYEEIEKEKSDPSHDAVVKYPREKGRELKETTLVESKATTKSAIPVLENRPSINQRCAAIPAIRWGGTFAPSRIRTERRSESKESRYEAIEFPHHSNAAPKWFASSSAGPPRKTSSLPFRFSAILLALLCLGGFAWFEWRKYSLPTNKALLYQKAEQGDSFSQATLGLSLIRGERGSELNREEGIAFLEAASKKEDPLAFLALGSLRLDGFYDPQDSKAARDYFRLAFEKRLEEKLQSVNDPRWWSLAARAWIEIEGDDSEQANNLLKKASARNYPEACWLLARLSGSDQDLWDDAEDSARRAMNRDSVYSRRLLSEIHLDENFTRAEPRFGEEQMELAAREGDIIAKMKYAEILRKRGEENEEAFQWMSSAADSNLVPAIGKLADYYEKGIGTAPDPSRALELARIASARSDPHGTLVVARITLENGDKAEANRLLQPLADSGNTEAASLLASSLLASGSIVDAENYLRISAESGDGESAFSLGKLLAASPNQNIRKEGIRWLEFAHEEGVVGASTALVNTIDDPNQSSRDPERAVELLEGFVDEGDHLAAVQLSEYYLAGRGTGKDPGKALLLLREAADAETSTAWFPLAELLERGIEGMLPPSSAAAVEAYQNALDEHDPRIPTRFPVLSALDEIVKNFVQSWESESYQDTLSKIGGSPEFYFHLESPDASQIAALEKGARALWPDRSYISGTSRNISLISLEEVALELPVNFRLARETWKLSGSTVMKMSLVEKPGSSWKISSLSENDQSTEFHPSRDRFEIGSGIRNHFPAIPVEEAAYDPVNLPRKQVEYVRTFPFKDRFGGRHPVIPTATRGELLIFSRTNTGGDIVLPAAHFDESTLESISNMIASQSFDLFETQFAGITTKRKKDNPSIEAMFSAASSGNHESEALVGEKYFEGSHGFPFDRIEAVKWFVRSARGKHPLGRMWLAIMTKSGEIKSSDPVQGQFRSVFPDLAPLIATSSVRAEYWRATGECFAESENLDLGDRQPRELLQRAINQGDLRAKLLMGRYMVEGGSNVTDGLRHLRSAADGGCASAAMTLGNYYLEKGNDPDMAFRLYRSAANQNMPSAQLSLGACYAHGKGTAPDQVLAAFWIHLALRNAKQQADKALEIGALEMIRVMETTIGKDNYRRAENFLGKKFP